VLVCGRWWPGLSPFAGLPSARVVLTARTPPELQRLLRHVRRSAPPYGVSLHGSLLTESVVARLREHVEVVMSWAVNDEERLRTVLDLGVNGIISDSHEVLRSVLAAR
jgi:glycerophosphoryl diester phosphodiesterase